LIFFQTFFVFFHGISKSGGTETTTTITATTTNRFDFIRVGQKISTIIAEDGGDQTSITQTSRLEIVQSQFEGL
jgi:hypothetical protein